MDGSLPRLVNRRYRLVNRSYTNLHDIENTTGWFAGLLRYKGRYSRRLDDALKAGHQIRASREFRDRRERAELKFQDCFEASGDALLGGRIPIVSSRGLCAFLLGNVNGNQFGAEYLRALPKRDVEECASSS